MKPGRTIAFLLLTVAAVYVWSQTSGVIRRTGYLAANEMPDTIRIAPPAPMDGDPVDTKDRAVFHATRSYQGTPRWAMALADNNISIASLLQTFSCSAGLSLTPENAPRLTALLSRMTIDIASESSRLKNYYQRKRPFLSEEGPICVARTMYQNNPDYPSGHTIEGWSVGLILAELEPDRAAEILVRARAFGESRVVCGVHYASAVDAGWTIADALVAATHGSAAFRSDLEAARAEVTALRAKSPLKSKACDAEAALIARRAY